MWGSILTSSQMSLSPGNNYTSGYVNPSLAYAMTFTCPGNTFLVYALVYWLGPLIGESSYISLIPRKVLQIINVENHTVQKWLLVFLRGVVNGVFFQAWLLRSSCIWETSHCCSAGICFTPRRGVSGFPKGKPQKTRSAEET